MAKNRIVKVRSTGFIRISPGEGGTSTMTITSTLNSVMREGKPLSNVTETDPHLSDRTVLEMRAILKMLLRLKEDFDKSSEIDSFFFKKFVDTEVTHPPRLNRFETENLKNLGLKWRALEQDIKHRLATASCSAEHLASESQSVRYNNCSRSHVTINPEDFAAYTNDLESHFIVIQPKTGNTDALEMGTQEDHSTSSALLPQVITYKEAPPNLKRKIEMDFKTHQGSIMLEDNFLNDAWKRTQGLSPTCNVDQFERYEHLAGETITWRKFVTTVPASASLVFAYMWSHDSEERMRIHEVESTKAVSEESLNMSTFLPRERRSLTDESGNPTRSQVIFETRKFPQQYRNRKRETYQMWDKIKDEDGYLTFVVVSRPIQETLEDDNFDIHWRNQVDKFREEFCYTDTELVLSTIKGVTLVKEVSKNVCEVTLISTQDCKIFITPWIKELVDREMLDLIDDMQRKFQRNWIFVDAEIRHHFMERLIGGDSHRTEELKGNSLDVARKCFATIDHLNGVKNYDDDETYEAMFNRFNSFCQHPATEWRPMASLTPWLSMSIMTGTKKKTICRGVTIVDASPAEVCAHFFNNTSPARMNSFFDEGNIARVTAHTNSFNDKVVGTIYRPRFGGLGFAASRFTKPQEETLRMIVGGPSDEKLAIWMQSADEHIEYGSGVSKKTAQAYFTGILIAENYVHAGDVAAGTKLTFFCSANKNLGFLSSYEQLVVPLTTLVDAKEKMDKSELKDDENLSYFTDLMSDDLEEGSSLPDSSPDSAFVESVRKEMNEHNDDANFMEFLDSDSRSRSYFVRIRRKMVEANRNSVNKEGAVRRRSSLFTSSQNSMNVYKTQAVYDVNVEEAAAAYWLCNSRMDLEKMFADDGLPSSVVELNVYRVSSRCQIRETKLKTKGRWAGRTFRLLEKMVWTKVSEDTIVVAHGSAEAEWWDTKQPEPFDNTAREDVDEDGRRYGRWEININHCLDGERGKIGGNDTFSKMELEVKEVVVFRSLEPIGETSQTSVVGLLSLKQRGQTINILKPDAEEQICLKRISRLTWLRTHLDKSHDIDSHARSVFKAVIEEKQQDVTHLSHAYTDIEKIMISQAVLLLNQFEHTQKSVLPGFEHTSVEHELAIMKPQDVGTHGGRRRQSNNVSHRYNSNDSGQGHSSGNSSGGTLDHSAFGKLVAGGSSSDQGLLLQDIRTTEALKTTLKAASFWVRGRFVANAPIGDVVSYYWCFNCRCRLKETDVERKVLTINSPYSIVGQMVTKASIKALAQRCMFTMMWYAIDSQHILVVSFPKDAIMFTSSVESAQRVKKIWVASVKSLGDGTKCRVTYMCGQEGIHRRTRVNTRLLASDLKDSMNSRWYFLGLKDLNECDEMVGHGIGEEFCSLSKFEEETGTKDVAARVREVAAYNKSLSKLVIIYPWFISMLTAILENRIRHTTVVQVSPHDLSNRQARNIGHSFTFSLVTCLLPSSAVDEWILKSRAMQEFDMEFHWFRPMLDSIAFKLLHDIAYGLKLRVFVGAMICICDVVTDISMIVYFFKSQGMSSKAGWLTSSSVGFSIFLQLCIVHLNGRKDNWKEKLIVIFCLKPLVDAWRIVKTGGNDLSATKLFSPVQEAVFCKFVEMMFESIPATVVQAQAYLSLLEDGNEAEIFPIVSIALGCMSTGYILTSVAYDLDIDPTKRSNFACRGWVPDSEKGRLYCFALMLLTSSMQCFQTAFGFAMLYFVYIRASKGKLALVVFLNLPMWLIIKVLRSEWTCWVPIYRKSGQAFTLLFRVAMSILNMFSVSPFFADPTYIGSLYIPTMVVLQGTCVYLFTEKFDLVAFNDGALVGQILYVVSVALPLTIVLMFLVGIKRSKVRYFFFAPKQEDMYLKAWTLSDNGGKIDMVINTHEDIFRGCQENIRSWIQDNWENWQEDEIFSSDIMGRIPEKFMPVELWEETHPDVKEEEEERGKGTVVRPSIRHLRPSMSGILGERNKRMSGGKGRMPRRTVLASAMQQIMNQNTHGETAALISSVGMKKARLGVEGEYIDNWMDFLGEKKLHEINGGGGGKKGVHRDSNSVGISRRGIGSGIMRGGGGRRKSVGGMRRRSGVMGKNSQVYLTGERRDSAVQDRVRRRIEREGNYREKGDA